MDVWFMVHKISVFEIQKQRTKSCKDPSYGYGEINQNIPKFALIFFGHKSTPKKKI